MKATSAILALLCLATQPLVADPLDIVVPAIHIPARHIPGIHIPGRTIPALHTAAYDIPEIIIPDIDVPAIDIPAVDNTGFTIVWNDLHRADVIAYVQTVRKSTPAIPRVSTSSVAERIRTYRSQTPWATEEMIRLFSSANLDDSGSLSWSEVEAFQSRLFRGYRYFTSRAALRPDQFLAKGGGDCKAFSLMAAEFFRFWGWDAWTASFFDEDSGHMICFARANSQTPARYIRVRLMARKSAEGDRIPDGDYVPIDYDQVGGYSSATKAGMKMTNLFSPGKIYGEFL